MPVLSGLLSCVDIFILVDALQGDGFNLPEVITEKSLG